MGLQSSNIWDVHQVGCWLLNPKVSAETLIHEVTGILSDEEIRRVEEIHSEHFAWEKRRWRLLEVVRGAPLEVWSSQCIGLDLFRGVGLDRFVWYTSFKKLCQCWDSFFCLKCWSWIFHQMVGIGFAFVECILWTVLHARDLKWMRGGYYFEAWKKHLFDKVYGGDYLFGFSLKSIEFDWVVRQNTASCGVSLVGFCSTFLKCNSSKIE